MPGLTGEIARALFDRKMAEKSDDRLRRARANDDASEYHSKWAKETANRIKRDLRTVVQAIERCEPVRQSKNQIRNKFFKRRY